VSPSPAYDRAVPELPSATAQSAQPETGRRGAGNLGARLLANIQERVAHALGGRAAVREHAETRSGIADLGERMVGPGDETDARVWASLARRGIADGDVYA
jgi:hypothetical protein